MLVHTTTLYHTTLLFTSGRIPLDPRLTQCLEEGKSYVDAYIGAPAQVAMADIVKKLLNKTESTDSSDKTLADANKNS